MSYVFIRRILIAGVLGASTSVSLFAAPTPAPVPLVRVEPGLEAAVKWKWKAVPSDSRAWGLPIPLPPPEIASSIGAPSTPAPAATPSTYEVKKGDALILIAKKLGLTVLQLKTYNALPNDNIRVGQVLDIPSHEEAKAIGPFPEVVRKTTPGKKAADDPAESLRAQLANVPVQAFLDRAGFSIGPIDGQTGLIFEKVRQLYLSNHPDTPTPAALEQKARATLGDGLTRYVLRPEDFRFIAPPRAERFNSSETSDATGKNKPKSPTGTPSIKYQDLVDSTMLAYHTPWEFVAERFHCDTAFLRALNPQIKTVPTIGTEFRVPSVEPFAIEKTLSEPIQPAPDAQNPITAAVVDLSLVTISQNGRLIAVMPMSVARPGLRGRGTWTVLNAIPRPRLATLQEPAAPPKRVVPLYGSDAPEPPPVPVILTSEQYLPAGPKNPVGVIWINLAKADSIEPLPYGLTGTSIPDKMRSQESIGGFRLTNWDIARAAHLLPVGSPLEWTQEMAGPAAAPAVRPAEPVSGSGPLFSQP